MSESLEGKFDRFQRNTNIDLLQEIANGGGGGGGPTDPDLVDIANLSPSNDDILQRKAGHWVNRTAAQFKTDLVLVKADVGLSLVNNTADPDKIISTLTQAALDAKQNLDSDLTAIAVLSPTNNDIIQRKSGAWTNRTVAQFKTDLSLTAADVGLANVNDTSDPNKPVSTATQTALNAKSDTTHSHLEIREIISSMTKYGLVAATGDFAAYQDPGSFTNQFFGVRILVRAGVAFSKMTMPIRSTGVFTPGSGKPNQLMWWDDSGVLQQITPDDDHMWETADWYVANLPANNVAQPTDRWIYVGASINGYSGGTCYSLTKANDSGAVPFSHAPGSSKRFGFYAGGVTTHGNINVNTIGTLTSFVPFIGLLV